MKKLILLLFLLTAGYFLFAQVPTDRRPYPDEENQLVGVTNKIQNELWKRVVYNVTIATTNYTINGTNDFVILVRNPVAFLNHIMLPDCTNNAGRFYEIITSGSVNTAVLTNANLQTFEGATNVTATSYTMSSNWVVRVYSTGTNWWVSRLQNGNN
jgi:hypothetical protein